MTETPVPLKAVVNSILVKWDSSVGENPPALDNPSEHPACLEVISIEHGKDPVTLYRRTA